MARFSLALILFCFGASAQAAPYTTVIQCKLVNGFEIAVQNKGPAYYLSLFYGGKTEFRERLKKPRSIRLDRTKERVDFELHESGRDGYLVKIAANFDDEASFDEIVHYKIPPKSGKPKSYKVYEAAGDGLPLKELGCVR
ncbi:MAG: hypothetical protein ABL958_01975 [Bdellovibrionia bacterium]